MSTAFVLKSDCQLVVRSAELKGLLSLPGGIPGKRIKGGWDNQCLLFLIANLETR